jgi:hypothetical protein
MIDSYGADKIENLVDFFLLSIFISNNINNHSHSGIESSIGSAGITLRSSDLRERVNHSNIITSHSLIVKNASVVMFF